MYGLMNRPQPYGQVRRRTAVLDSSKVAVAPGYSAQLNGSPISRSQAQAFTDAYAQIRERNGVAQPGAAQEAAQTALGTASPQSAASQQNDGMNPQTGLPWGQYPPDAADQQAAWQAAQPVANDATAAVRAMTGNGSPVDQNANLAQRPFAGDRRPGPPMPRGLMYRRP